MGFLRVDQRSKLRGNEEEHSSYFPCICLYKGLLTFVSGRFYMVAH